MEWLDRDSFLNLFKKQYLSQKKYLEERILLDLSLEQLILEVPFDPIKNPDDGDQVGPIEKWYGKDNDFLFTVTYFHHHLTNRFTLIDCAVGRQEDEPFMWSVIQRFENAPKIFLENIIWIKNEIEKPNFSIYTRDHSGILRNVYSSIEENEIIDLKRYLKKKSEKLYFVYEPEERDENWCIIDRVNGGCLYDPNRGREHCQEIALLAPNYKNIETIVRPKGDNDLCQKWVLCGQDDSGNTFSIEEYWSKLEAEYAKYEFERRGHKQIYWIEARS